MEKVQREYKEILNVIIIYISEAHAKDEWPISHYNERNQHRNLKERISAAKRIFKDGNNFNMKILNVYCDNFSQNNFESRFCGWPERAYLLKGMMLEYISYHKIDGIDDWYTQVENEIRKE